MKRFLRATFYLLAALHLAGGHWGVLQVVAWAQMLRDYSQQSDVITAVKETFDGEHPCSMCLKITKGKNEEQQNQGALPAAKFEMASSWMRPLDPSVIPDVGWKVERHVLSFSDPVRLTATGRAAPPLPPPRAA